MHNRPLALIQRPTVLLSWAQRRARSSESVFILIATGVGAIAGLTSVLQGAVARTLQHFLFRLPDQVHLSGTGTLEARALLALPLGGLLLGIFSMLVRARRRKLVDVVEANALHGGRMSIADSLVISGQTMLSNGFGASVGLEAAYAQLGGATASAIGERLRLRRADLRALVGAGTGAAIAAAFGAPLAGAFYAFEIAMGAYTPSALAPVAAAALSGTLVAQVLGARPYLINAMTGPSVEAHHYLIYAALGIVCALIGIALMRAVAIVERGVRRLQLPDLVRPPIGGLLLIPLALVSPQALSAGHGALHIDLALGTPIAFLALIFIAKALASIVSLGFGFRGGLFFASLFLGSLIGHMFADMLAMAAGGVVVDPRNAALVGMAALSVSVIGGPMTMAMLVLEATHDVSLTGAVLAASLVASTAVREWFGYSFSTWRLHLRGETVKSARDIGWVKSLTAGGMMRRETRATPAAMTIAEFRRRFPLGATSRVVLVDGEGRYAGIVQPASAYADDLDADAPVDGLAVARGASLTPEMDIVAIMRSFDAVGGDELAVLDAHGTPIGLLSEGFVRRRYAEELEKAQRHLFGEG